MVFVAAWMGAERLSVDVSEKTSAGEWSLNVLDSDIVWWRDRQG